MFNIQSKNGRAIAAIPTALALMAAPVVQAGSSCLPLELPEASAFLFGGTGSFMTLYSVELSNVGGVRPDYMDIFFFYEGMTETGTFDLSMGEDASHASCLRCITMCVDYDEDDGECLKWLFQDRGLLTLDAPPSNGILSFSVQGLRLVESTIDQGTSEAIPVPGGVCYSTDAVATTEVFVDGFEVVPAR